MVSASTRTSAMSSAGPFTAVVIRPPLSHLAAGDLLEQSVYIAGVIAQQLVGLEHVVDAEKLLTIGDRRLWAVRGGWSLGHALHDDHPEALRAARLARAPYEPVFVTV